MRLIGFALGYDPRGWQWGWTAPATGPAEGDWWLCLGPLCLMFEDGR